ncbi:MAG: tetratricopeptide repeat protein [Crocinitomicaceae bacterium]
MKFILLSIIVLISALVQGQSNLDSLKIEMNEAKKNQDNSSVAKINWRIGDILKKKDPEKALINYQEAAAIYEAQNDLVNYANILNNIGWVYKQLGNNDQALFNFESALKIFKKENYKKGEAEVLNNIGTLYRNIGDLSKAIKFLTKASEISRDLGNEKYMPTTAAT